MYTVFSSLKVLYYFLFFAVRRKGDVMELSSCVTKKWEVEFEIKEMWFEPDTGGFFRQPATVYVIGIPVNNEKHPQEAISLEIFFSKIKVGYKNKGPSSLLIAKRIVEGQMMDAFMSGSYEREEIEYAHFYLAPNDRILVKKQKE